jgi:hypothetical protein
MAVVFGEGDAEGWDVALGEGVTEAVFTHPVGVRTGLFGRGKLQDVNPAINSSNRLLASDQVFNIG